MLKIGDKLPNGAIVLDIREKNCEIFILCLWKKEFVSWGYDPQGGTYWGHYFPSLQEAMADFDKRISN